MNEIKKRWLNAEKIYGDEDMITTASGVQINGRYLLVESGAVTPSHNPMKGFVRFDDFPVDANGQTVNDRDYERDTDAQQITRNIAATYDSRALQNPVVVSRDGVVFSGNGRTMAGMIAARNDTDAAYISYLSQFSKKYGFTNADVYNMNHPRVVFMCDDDFPYTAETFAMFNAQEMKSQSKTEQAVKLGKVVDDATFSRIVRSINTFDSVADFYNNTRAATEAINELCAQGIISTMQLPEMFDGDSISAQAREILENVLIGKAFGSNPDAVRQITAFKGIRKNIITALSEISTNIALKDYSLESEMAQAINLCYQARSNGNMYQGDIVSGFARQTQLFGDSTVADYNDAAVLILADMVNHSQVTRLKRLFIIYNRQAQSSASGQVDMFSGGVKTKKEIINEVCEMLNYDNRQLAAQISEAVEHRKAESKTIILKERIALQTQEEMKKLLSETPAMIAGVSIGDICGLKLDSGEVIAVVLECIKGKAAGIRLKGWSRCFVPAKSVIPFSSDSLTLPYWFQVGAVVSDGVTIDYIGRDSVALSDGSAYSPIDILMNFGNTRTSAKIA